METKNNAHNIQSNASVKKQWQQPRIIEISKVDVEKNALATKESIAPGAFTPISQYHS